jgi:ketosteroid isomerase-like protein
MVKYWTDDIIVITSRNSRFVGKHQYATGLAQEFKTKEEVVYIRNPETIEIFPAWKWQPNLVVGLEPGKVAMKNVEVTGTYYAKWKKLNDQWMISAEVFTPLKCSGGNYCLSVPK